MIAHKSGSCFLNFCNSALVKDRKTFPRFQVAYNFWQQACSTSLYRGGRFTTERSSGCSHYLGNFTSRKSGGNVFISIRSRAALTAIYLVCYGFLLWGSSYSAVIWWIAFLSVRMFFKLSYCMVAVTPERLCTPEFMNLLGVVYQQGQLNRLVVDEVSCFSWIPFDKTLSSLLQAHCISVIDTEYPVHIYLLIIL